MKFQPMRLIDLEQLAAMIRVSSPGMAIDYYAVEIWGIDSREWAEMTNRELKTVQNSVSRARNNFEDEEKKNE